MMHGGLAGEYHTSDLNTGEVLKSELICNQCHKFGICRLTSGGVDGIAENTVQHVYIASVPGNFNSMTDCTLNTGGGCVVALGNGGVKQLCYAVYHLVIVDRKNNRGT